MKKFLVAVFAGLAPVTAAAHGALAIGLPQSVEHEGFAYGVTWDFPNVSEAAERAMKRCREENVPAKEHCRVLRSFARECVAIAMDPAPGTPGVGWGIGPTREAASATASKMCHDTGGESRRAYCTVSNVECDTRP